MKKLRRIIAITVLTVFTSSANSEPLIVDSFESADMSATNQHGFSWGNNNGTSVVTKDAVVYNNDEMYKVPSRDLDWTPKHGEHSLRFWYGAGEPQAEQRFNTGKGYPELWMSFWLRVPVNFLHPSDRSYNQKLFRLWMDGYGADGNGSTVGMSFRPDGRGGSYFFAKISSGNYSGVGGDLGSAPFITFPDDQGKWMKIVVQVRSETSPGSQDGIMNVWRKWEGDEEFQLTHSLSSQPIKLDIGAGGFAAGYLMGWANGPYEEHTEFFIDKFSLSEEPLLSQTISPNPPTSLQVE